MNTGKYFIGSIAVITVLLVFTAIPFSAHAAVPCELYMSDETVEFSPEGYTPTAVANVPSIEDKIHYYALNADTSVQASIPIRETGTFHIMASFDGNKEYSRAECASTVTILPVEAYIVTDYHTVAHTGMDNPLPYRVEPQWAKDYLDISISYSPIETLNDVTNETVNVPVSPGMYYTKVSVSSLTSGVKCSNKYLVYKIAEYRGNKLSEAEARASVPNDFKCNIRDRRTEYQSGTKVLPAYNVTPAMLEVSLLYRKTDIDGTYSEFTSVPPEEPGDYEVVCFVDETQIGIGHIVIDKLSASIEMCDVELPFAPSGIYPEFTSVTPSGIDVAYSVYPINADGSPVVDPISLPITKCGKYLVAAYPSDTEHYITSYSYAYINVVPIDAVITTEDATFGYDGTAKPISVSVEPEWVQYEIEYYTVDSEGNAKDKIASAPSSAGEYIALVTVSENDGSVNPVAKLVTLKIEKKNIALTTDDEKNSNASVVAVVLVILAVISVAVYAFIRFRTNARGADKNVSEK